MESVVSSSVDIDNLGIAATLCLGNVGETSSLSLSEESGVEILCKD